MLYRKVGGGLSDCGRLANEAGFPIVGGFPMWEVGFPIVAGCLMWEAGFPIVGGFPILGVRWVVC